MSNSLSPEKIDELAEQLMAEIRAVALRLQPKLASIQNATLDSHLDRDLGFDSLGRVELISRIEKHFSVQLPETLFSEAESPRDLLRGLMNARHASPEDLQRIDVQLSDIGDSPEQVETLIEMLDWHARLQPEFPHIRLYQDEDNYQVITYGDLQKKARQVAASLQHSGLIPGDTVGLMLPTGEDYFFSFFGVLYAGGIPVPVYPPARPSQLEDHMLRQAGILDNAGCRFLITVRQAMPLAGILRAQVNSLQDVVTLAALLKPSGAYSRPRISSSDIAFIQYTSGSTGNPKGVVLTHANLLANIRVDGNSLQADSKDVFVSWLPLYHDMGLIGAWLGSLYFSVQLVIMSPLVFLARPVRWFQAIHRFGGTLSAAPNFAYELCLNRITDDELKGLDLSTWRLALNGAEAVSPQTIRRFIDRFSIIGFRPETMFPVYGLAECSVGLAFPTLGNEPVIDRINRDALALSGRALAVDNEEAHALEFVGCGRVLSGHELRIVDTKSQLVPDRYQGRVQFKGPSATSGYYRNPEATASLFDGDWLETGDLAYLVEGDLFITGRSKDLIIRAGRNIYPHELEQAVGEVDGVRKGRVAVFATMDKEKQTEQLVVLAESREQDEQLRQSLWRQINELTTELTGVAADDIVLAPPATVLKTSSGKIRRAACRELYEQGRIGKTGSAIWVQVLRLQLTALPNQLQRLFIRSRELLYAFYSQFVFHVLAGIVAIAVLSIPVKHCRWRLLRPMAKVLSLLTAVPLKVEGLSNLLPADRSCIFVANHSSYLDVYAISAALPARFRFVAKAELSRHWFPRTFLSRIGTLFVDRFNHADGVAALQSIEKAVQQGDSLLFFPEGTFTHAPGLRPFHMGAFLAAAKSGLPVLPVTIKGTRSILAGNSWLSRRGKITVNLGEAIETEKLRTEGESDWELALRVKELARGQIAESCGEPDMGHEPVFPPHTG